MSDILYKKWEIITIKQGGILMGEGNYIISDSGLSKKHDKFGIVVSTICVIAIFILIFLGTMALTV